MKIVLVVDTFPPLRSSGAVQIRDLTREFVRQGHQLTVLVPDSTIKDAWMIENFHGAQVLRLRSPRIKDLNYWRRIIGEWLMPHSMWRNLLRSPVAGQSWEAIVWYSPSIFHTPLVRKLKQKCGCKGYLIIRDIFPQWALDLGIMRPGPSYWLLTSIAWRQYQLADIIGVQSHGNLNYFEEWRAAKNGRSVEVLQNWLDKPVHKRCPIRINDTSLAGRKILVYAGNMGVAQGLDIFLEMAGRLNARLDIGFVFVGRGAYADRLKNVASARHLSNVLFCAEVEPDEIPDLYAQCDAGIVALDHRHRSHNIPGKFLTYMRSGLPVLANINSGNDLAYLIRHENVGEVCETNDLEELEKHCLNLVQRLDKDPNLTRRCTRLFESEFSVSKAVQQLVASMS